MIDLYIYCTFTTVRSMLHAKLYTTNWPHMMFASNFITGLFMCSIFVLAGFLNGKNKGRWGAWSGIHVCQQPLLPPEDRDRMPWPQGENGQNRAGRVAGNNAGGRLPCFMVWDPAPNPPPSPSSFLQCTVVYTWATIRSTVGERSEAEQWDNEAVQRGSAGLVSNAWHVVL